MNNKGGTIWKFFFHISNYQNHTGIKLSYAIEFRIFSFFTHQRNGYCPDTMKFRLQTGYTMKKMSGHYITGNFIFYV